MEECKDKGQGKCCSCGGQHRVMMKVAVKFKKKVVEIQQIKTKIRLVMQKQ